MLHGTAVASTTGVCFVGPTGAGKSTLCALLCHRGYSLVSEGMVAVSCTGSRPMLRSGPPVFRLLDDALERLDEAPERYPMADTSTPKRCFPAPRGAREARPLSTVYALADGNAEHIQELHGAEAVAELMRNLYLRGRLDTGEAATALSRCAYTARLASVRRVYRRKRVDLIDSVVDMIMRDICSGKRTSAEEPIESPERATAPSASTRTSAPAPRRG